jgi:hypothetical protein
MQENNIRFQDLDQVLLSAQTRRSVDLGEWLTQFLRARREARLQEKLNRTNAVNELRRVAVLVIFKFPDVTKKPGRVR